MNNIVFFMRCVKNNKIQFYYKIMLKYILSYTGNVEGIFKTLSRYFTIN